MGASPCAGVRAAAPVAQRLLSACSQGAGGSQESSSPPLAPPPFAPVRSPPLIYALSPLRFGALVVPCAKRRNREPRSGEVRSPRCLGAWAVGGAQRSVELVTRTEVPLKFKFKLI